MPEELDRLVSRRTMLSLTAAAVAGSLAACSQPAHPAVSATPARRRFEGKVVIITGATSGIGRAAALAFAAEGAKVGFCGRREGLGHALEQQIRTRGAEATYTRADVRVENDVKSFVDQVAARYGRIDIAFNNAGITLEKPLHEYSSAGMGRHRAHQPARRVPGNEVRDTAHARRRRRKHRRDFILKRYRDHRSPLCLCCEQAWTCRPRSVRRSRLCIQRNSRECPDTGHNRHCPGKTGSAHGRRPRRSLGARRS